MKFKNVFIIIFLIIQISQICSLTIPLYTSNYNFKDYSDLEFMDSILNNFKYTYVEMGNPSQKFPIIFKTEHAQNIIKAENLFPDSFYNLNISETIQYYYDKSGKRIYIKDIITFDKNYKEILINFLYDKWSLIESNNYGIIGLGYIMPNEEENNFFYQLKKMQIIGKNIFYFNYTNDNQIFLNIGFEPYENDNSFSTNASKLLVDPILDYEFKTGIAKRQYNWNLNFSRVFYFRKIPLQKQVDPYVEISRMKVRKVNFFQALIVPEEDLIKGPFEYMEKLDEDFFDQLIKDNICQKKIFGNRYYYFCKKEQESLIKNTFPPLYFFHTILNYIFELRYEDLWFEKGGFLFFGIYFERFLIEVYTDGFISEWNFGKLFLKKYCFAFDFQNNQLLFYKKNKIGKKKIETNNPDENKSNSNKKIYQLGLILVVITIGVFAFLLDRFARRKYKVNSLLIDYENPQA